MARKMHPGGKGRLRHLCCPRSQYHLGKISCHQHLSAVVNNRVDSISLFSRVMVVFYSSSRFGKPGIKSGSFLFFLQAIGHRYLEATALSLLRVRMCSLQYIQRKALWWKPHQKSHSWLYSRLQGDFKQGHICFVLSFTLAWDLMEG